MGNRFLRPTTTPLPLTKVANHRIGVGISKTVCSAICTNLLSSPSPLASPRTISAFLEKLLEKAIQSPCADTIRPIYKILAGTGSHLLEAIPPSTTARLQEQFKKMLQNFELEDHSANLFCLATLALMSSTQVAVSSPEGGSSSRLLDELADVPARTRNSGMARQYFVSKRASKTLDLVVLIAVFLCSKNHHLGVPKAIENLRLACVIITAIDDAERLAWLQSDKGKVRKLVERIIAHDGQPEVSCAALQVTASLLGDCPLPQELHPVCRALFCAPTAFLLAPTIGAKLLLLLDEGSVQEHLLSLFRAADTRRDRSTPLIEIDTALLSVESFLAATPTSVSLRNKVLYLLSTNRLKEPLRHFLNAHEEYLQKGASLGHSDICPYISAKRRALLSQKICTLFMKIAMFSQHDDLKLDPSIASALLDKMTSLAPESVNCGEFADIRRPRRSPPASLFELENTPCSSASSEHWKARVKHDLVQNADHQYQTIVRSMGDVCQDLERRCNEVERPLREEQAKTAQLLSELDESRRTMAGLESLNQEQRLMMQGTEKEKNEMVSLEEDMRQEREELWSQVEESRKEVRIAHERVSVVTQRSASEVKELQLFHALAIAEKEDRFEAQLQVETALKARIDDLESAAAELRSKASATDGELLRLKETCLEQRTSLEYVETMAHEKDNAIDQQQQLLSSLGAEKVELQFRVESLSEDCRSLRGELENKGAIIQSRLTELHEMRAKYENELFARSQDCRELQGSHERKLEELQTLREEETEVAARKAEENDAVIQDLEKELSKVRSELKDQESELEEARKLQEQVMSFWSKQRPRHDKIERDAIVARGNNVGDANQIQSRNPSTSAPLQQVSPYHKRNRRSHHRSSSIRTKNFETAPADAENQGLRDEHTSVRRPLDCLNIGTQRGREKKSTIHGGDSRKRTARWASHEIDQDENVDTAMTEVSICDSDFFASTDQELVAGAYATSPQSLPDDTTAEF
ncbi:MAG: hypothetical protein Q9222_002613 [Ikaeria aurantiellina]